MWGGGRKREGGVSVFWVIASLVLGIACKKIRRLQCCRMALYNVVVRKKRLNVEVLFLLFFFFFLKFYGGARERGKAKTLPRHCYLQSRPGWPASKVASKESEASAAAGKKWRRGELRGWQVGRRCLVSTFPSSVWPPRSSSEHGPPLMDQTVVLCTLAAFLLYYNTLHADFAYDDR